MKAIGQIIGWILYLSTALPLVIMFITIVNKYNLDPSFFIELLYFISLCIMYTLGWIMKYKFINWFNSHLK